MEDDPGSVGRWGGFGTSNMKTEKWDRAYIDNQTACDLCCLTAELKQRIHSICIN